MEIITQALKNIKRKKLRSILIIFSISIGVASVLIIGCIGESGKVAVNAELDSLGLNGVIVSASSPDSLSVLKYSDLEKLESIEEIEETMPVVMYYTNFDIKSEKYSSILWGINSGAKQIISLNLKYGREISATDVKNKAKVCMIDQYIANKSYKRDNIVGKTINLNLNGTDEEYTIIGIVEKDSSILQSVVGEYMPNFVYIPFTTLQENAKLENIDQIAVKIKKEADFDTVTEKITAVLGRDKQAETEIKTENLAKQRNKLSNMLNIVTLILSAIGAISLLVAGLGIMTIMLVSVNERMHEIGIKKSIGATNFRIMCDFFTESVLISLIGSFIGIFLGLVIVNFVAFIMGFHIIIKISTIFLTIFLTMTVGMFFGVFPSYKASKLCPVDALRNN